MTSNCQLYGPFTIYKRFYFSNIIVAAIAAKDTISLDDNCATVQLHVRVIWLKKPCYPKPFNQFVPPLVCASLRRDASLREHIALTRILVRRDGALGLLAAVEGVPDLVPVAARRRL